MRYIVAFGLIALMNGWMAMQQEGLPAALCFGYLSVSFAALALLYFARPSLTKFKSSAGRLRLVGIIIFAPYLFFSTGLLRLQACFLQTSAFHQIISGLVIGRRPFTFDIENLQNLGINSIVDLTWEFQEDRFITQNVDYLSVPVLDGTAPTPEQLKAIVHWVGQRQDKVVLIHCALGHSRSALVVSALLLVRQQATSPEAAVKILQAVRPGVGSNFEQRNRLTEFFDQFQRSREL